MSTNSLSLITINVYIAIEATQYTPVQIWMASDEWDAAFAEWDQAMDGPDQIQALIADQYGNQISSTLALIAEARSNAKFAEFSREIARVNDDLTTDNPLTLRKHLARHSSEAYPVGKTLKAAAKLRKAAKTINALVDEYNKE